MNPALNMTRLIRDLYLGLLTKEFCIMRVEYNQEGFITYIKLGLK